MAWTITFYNEKVQVGIMAFPKGIQARYIHLSRRMEEYGPNLRPPHVKALGNGLYEMRLKSKEGIGRVLYCTVVGKTIVMLHGFIKKSEKTPPNELDTARRRMSEVKKKYADT